MNIKQRPYLTISAILLMSFLFACSSTAFAFGPIRVSCDEDPGLAQMVDRLGLGGRQQRTDTGDTRGRDFSGRKAAPSTKNIPAPKSISGNFQAKTLAKDFTDIRADVFNSLNLFVSITTVVDLPWLAKFTYDTTMKTLPTVEAAVAELKWTCNATWDKLVRDTQETMREWGFKSQDAQKWMSKEGQEINDSTGYVRAIWHDAPNGYIDTTGQMYIKPLSREEAKKLEEQRRKEAKERDREKERSREWGAQAAAGMSGSGSDSEWCP